MVAPVLATRRVERFAAAGPTLLIVSAILFGVMAFVAKRATAHVPGAEVAFLRFVFGICAVAVAVVFGLKLHPVNWRGLFLRGLFGGIAVLLFFIAIEKLPVGTATLLNYTAPLFTALFAALFIGERLTFSTGLALVVTFGGVLLVLRGNAAPGEIGLGKWEACGLLSAAFSGAAVATIRAVRRTDGAWEIFGAFCLIGALATAPSTIHSWVTPRGTDWLLLGAVGLLSVVAQVIFIHALGYVTAATSGIIAQLTPVTAMALGVATLGEPLGMVSVIGSAITLAGVVWGARPPHR